MLNPALSAIHFHFDKSEIRNADAAILQANARWLVDNPNQLLLIEGHCDARGTNQYNLALGERRAGAAMKRLIQYGVDAARITLVSYGEERPTVTH
jgi:peptidoglycan-associated lipoprotein